MKSEKYFTPLLTSTLYGIFASVLYYDLYSNDYLNNRLTFIVFTGFVSFAIILHSIIRFGVG